MDLSEDIFSISLYIFNKVILYVFERYKFKFIILNINLKIYLEVNSY